MRQIIIDLQKKSPRKFWKYVKRFRKNVQSNNIVNIDEFKEYFSNLASSLGNPDVSVPLEVNTDQSQRIDDLDSLFTVEEIEEVILSLKRNKSCDLDGNVADFFIDARSFISPFLCTLFNHMFDMCLYPELWTKGVIVPIYKKGDMNEAANYRGITLVNTTSKIFSLLLRNRLNGWCEKSDYFSDSQFGFRDGRSTADAIFLLHSVIQKVLSNQSRLWCVFIDYQRAFDTVNRDALWHKLIQSGISCKMLEMLKCMYRNVKSCVRLNGTLSDFFDVTIGLKQGEPLSPILFLFFVNDIADNLDIESLTENDLTLLSKYLILFADDIVLFTTDPKSLQKQINSIYNFSVKWGLTINVKKTKVCVFEKRKSIHNNSFFINGEKVEIVDTFVYLGIKFNHTGTFSDAVRCLHDQALKAYSNLLYIFDRIHFDIKSKLTLFDSMVVPILLYGAEVWGIYGLKDVDKLHLRFCKYILGVKNQTVNESVLGELGRFPLSVISKERSVKFWLRFKGMPDSPMYHVYTDQCNSLNGNSWARKMHSFIEHLGFNNLILDHSSNSRIFPSIKQRIRDQYVQNWSASISSKPKLDTYRKFKKSFCYEEYLSKIQNDELRRIFTCFRLGSHKLEIEVGRFFGIERSNRHCKLCSQNLVENEYHFLLCCPRYANIRRKYFGIIQWPNINKFCSIMSNKNNKKIINTAKYIKECMVLRKNTLVAIAAF